MRSTIKLRTSRTRTAFVFVLLLQLGSRTALGAPDSEISLVGRLGVGEKPPPSPPSSFGLFEPSLIKLNEIDSSDDVNVNLHKHHRHPEKLHSQSQSCTLPPVCHAVAVGNTTSLEKCPPRANNLIGNSLKHLGCKPRPQIVHLTLPGPNYDLIPSVASVNRCGGYCTRTSTSCLPTKVTQKVVLVHQINKARGGGGHRPECATVELEEHEECRCGCEIQPHHCNSKQIYDYGSCSCLCTNMDEKYECEKHNHGRLRRQGPITPTAALPLSLTPSSLLIPYKKWNPTTCTCNCVTETDGDDNNNCPNDLMWVPKMCRCVRVPSGEPGRDEGEFPDEFIPGGGSEPEPEPVQPEMKPEPGAPRPDDDGSSDSQGSNSIDDNML